MHASDQRSDVRAHLLANLLILAALLANPGAIVWNFEAVLVTSQLYLPCVILIDVSMTQQRTHGYFFRLKYVISATTLRALAHLEVVSNDGPARD